MACRMGGHARLDKQRAHHMDEHGMSAAATGVRVLVPHSYIDMSVSMSIQLYPCMLVVGVHVACTMLMYMMNMHIVCNCCARMRVNTFVAMRILDLTVLDC